MAEHYSPAIHLIYSPEFLTERTAALDFQQANRLIFGDHYPDSQVNFTTSDRLNENVIMVTALFEGRFPKVPIYWCSMEEASLVKYGTNVFFTVVLSFWNELAQIAESFGLDPNEVAGMVMLDQRIGRSHWQVPGHDGDRGFGGHCFPKDINGYMHIAREQNVAPFMARAAWETNNKVRKNRNWETDLGRAVTVDYNDEEE